MLATPKVVVVVVVVVEVALSVPWTRRSEYWPTAWRRAEVLVPSSRPRRLLLPQE